MKGTRQETQFASQFEGKLGDTHSIVLEAYIAGHAFVACLTSFRRLNFRQGCDTTPGAQERHSAPSNCRRREFSGSSRLAFGTLDTNNPCGEGGLWTPGLPFNNAILQGFVRQV